MKSHYRVVVIGGGIVGTSVLYHLSKLGWSDIALVERAELTSGSTWHAAAGFHALNADPNIAALQDYTIKLYREIENESGQSVGLHMTGGVNFAGTPSRWEWLKSAWAIFQTMGVETARLVTADEIKELCPIVDISGIHGGLYDSMEGHLDPSGATHAFVRAAQKRGAEIILRNRVVELSPRFDGTWTVVTQGGTIIADHVVNAAGLWAKQVGRMAGIELPVTPMAHHYLITDQIAELAALDREIALCVDLEGFTYLRQEQKGVLLGVYELNPQHWHVDGAPWDYGMELIPEDIDRISPELAKGFERYPCLNKVGIKRWINGPFTFTPDGNPLVGPVPQVSNYWCACGVMAGFSQGGGVGLSLAQWIIEGEPGRDIFGMDVARYAPFAANREYLKTTTAQFYKRRFVMSYPNEQLPAGRPLRVPPTYDLMTNAGAQWGVLWGLEVPLYFAPRNKKFKEIPTLRRSNAFALVASECRATREQLGMLDISAFARYEIAGPTAQQWLDNVLACRVPALGKVRLAPMLSSSGRLMGDLTLLRWDDDCYWLMGSYYLRQWHMRWFQQYLPKVGVTLRDVSDQVVGFSIAGPNARTLLSRITEGDVSNRSFPFLSCRTMNIGLLRANVARLSVTGELGYEINVAASEQRNLYQQLMTAGEDLGIRQIGFTALNSLRMEKSFGIWSREYTWAYRPRMSGLQRYIAFEKKAFVGRDAALRDRDSPGLERELVTLEIQSRDADASGFEPIWLAERRVGFITSGAYGHCAEIGLAMAYIDSACLKDHTQFDVHVVGVKQAAHVIAASPVDPAGLRLRS
jgi:dimethylglycine dehydrogenase